MGKPEKFKVSAYPFATAADTVFEVKLKLCKVAKKLQKRSERKLKKLKSSTEVGNTGKLFCSFSIRGKVISMINLHTDQYPSKTRF